MSVLRNTTGQKWKCNKEVEKKPFQTEIQYHRANTQQKAQFQVTNSATNATDGRTAKKLTPYPSFKVDR